MIDRDTISFLNKKYTDVVIEELKEMTQYGVEATWTAKEGSGNIYFNGRITDIDDGYEMTIKHPTIR